MIFKDIVASLKISNQWRGRSVGFLKVCNFSDFELKFNPLVWLCFLIMFSQFRYFNKQFLNEMSLSYLFKSLTILAIIQFKLAALSAICIIFHTAYMEEHKISSSDQSAHLSGIQISLHDQEEEQKRANSSQSQQHESISQQNENHASNSSDSFNHHSRGGSSSSSQNPGSNQHPVPPPQQNNEKNKHSALSQRQQVERDENGQNQGQETEKVEGELNQIEEEDEQFSESLQIHRDNRDNEFILRRIEERIQSSQKYENVQKIKQLNLSDIQVCLLSFEFKYSMQQIRSLEIISFSNCKIDSFQYFPELPKLIGLDLANNNLTDQAQFEMISNLYPKLEVLLLQNNQICKFSSIKRLSDSKRLIELDLQGNPVTELEGYKMVVLASFLQIIFLDNHLLSEKRSQLSSEKEEQHKSSRGRKQRKLQNIAETNEKLCPLQHEKVDKTEKNMEPEIQGEKKFIRSDSKDLSIGKRRRPKARMNNFLFRNQDIHSEAKQKRKIDENSRKENEETLKKLMEEQKRDESEEEQINNVATNPRKGGRRLISSARKAEEKLSEQNLKSKNENSESQKSQNEDSEFDEFEIKKNIRQKPKKDEKSVKKPKKHAKIAKLKGMTNSELKAELRKSLKASRIDSAA